MKPVITILFLLLANTVVAQLWPKEGAALHYRLIGFTVPAAEKGTTYQLDIYTEGSNKPIISERSSTNHITATVPKFGASYSWQVKYLKNGKPTKTIKHKFTTLPNPYIDSPRSRLVIIDTATQYQDLLIFFDNTRTLYNMRGEALWFLPVIKNITDSSAVMIRDIKISPQGTITFLTNKNVYEIDYNANILWQGPIDSPVNGHRITQYHHQLTRRPNGNYMTIGNLEIKNADTTKGTQSCGTLIEYTPDSKLAWTWSVCDHLGEGDATTHFNSFYLDEERKVFYTSHRNISRVIKAEYPSGKTLAHYGSDYKRDGSTSGKGLFYSQHNAGINSNGDLILFNNNFNMDYGWKERNDTSVPTVLVLKEPATAKDTITKLWEFTTNIDTFTRPLSTGGGSITELNPGDYLVCTGLPGRNFIVSKDKKVLWNVITMHFDKTWKPLQGYRISPLYPNDVQKLLFK
jgi:hypothetical protein